MTLNDTIGLLGSSSYVYEGWYAGCQGVQSFGHYTCTSSASVDSFDEWYNAGNDTYGMFDNGTLAFNTGSIYRVEWSSANQCWYVYVSYNTLVDAMCSVSGGSVPGSGAASVFSEVHTHYSGDVVEMPLTYYGSSTPTTNTGLRIKGATGYQTWSTTLTTGSTGLYDERTTGLPYWISESANYYWFSAHGQNTG
jgi:hypothetical protein